MKADNGFASRVPTFLQTEHEPIDLEKRLTLILDVATNDALLRLADTLDKVPIAPEAVTPQELLKLREF